MTVTETRPPRAAVPAPGHTPGGPGGRHRAGTAAPAPRRRPRREHALLAVLLAGTGVLYLWNLSASGWANSFYAAAVQAGTQSWTAFFFGSLDAGNAITVDKPPAALWVMESSARIFGFSSWSILVPQALMGVAAVAVLYATVRRVAGPPAALVAGAAFALTPVAALMFRFDNPDALLTLLLVAAAYATTRAWETASTRAGTRWLVLAGVVIGFAFLTKMMQAFLILPALAAAYGVTARTGLWRRVRQIALAGAGVVVGAGWWLVAVSLWPEAARPYIGGSTNNSAWELALGYNGLGRILGNTGGGGGGASFGGTAGLLRLFNSEFGTQVSWLLPAALLLGAAGAWFVRRTTAPNARQLRGALVLWGGWTLVTGLTFSLMSGTIHPYYAVALAPGIAALVGIGGVLAWRARDTWAGRATLALSSAGTAVWAFVMLGWSDSSLTVLRWPILVAGVLAGAVLLLPPQRRLARDRRGRRAPGRAPRAGRVHGGHRAHRAHGFDAECRTGRLRERRGTGRRLGRRAGRRRQAAGRSGAVGHRAVRRRVVGRRHRRGDRGRHDRRRNGRRRARRLGRIRRSGRSGRGTGQQRARRAADRRRDPVGGGHDRLAERRDAGAGLRQLGDGDRRLVRLGRLTRRSSSSRPPWPPARSTGSSQVVSRAADRAGGSSDSSGTRDHGMGGRALHGDHGRRADRLRPDGSPRPEPGHGERQRPGGPPRGGSTGPSCRRGRAATAY